MCKSLFKYILTISLLFVLSSCNKPELFNAENEVKDKNDNLDSSFEKLNYETEKKVSRVLIPPPHEVSSEPRFVGEVKKEEELNVALLVPLSDDGSKIGKSMLDAVHMAASEIGAEKVNLIAIDSGITKNSATAALKKINERIDIIIGPIVENQLEVIYPYAKNSGINIISPIDSQKWANKDGLYLMGASSMQRFNSMLSYASKKGYENIYTILPENRMGESMEEMILAYQENEFINSAKVIWHDQSGKNKSFEKPIKQLQQALAKEKSNKSLLLLPQSGKNFRQLVQQLAFAKDENIKKLKLIGGSYIGDNSLSTVGWSDKFWFANPPFAARGEFEARFYNEFKYKALPKTSLAYDAFALILTNVEDDGKNIVFDPQNLLNKSGFEGVNGVFRFLSDGSNERLLSIFEVQKNGKIKEIEPSPTAFVTKAF